MGRFQRRIIQIHQNEIKLLLFRTDRSGKGGVGARLSDRSFRNAGRFCFEMNTNGMVSVMDGGDIGTHICAHLRIYMHICGSMRACTHICEHLHMYVGIRSYM